MLQFPVATEVLEAENQIETTLTALKTFDVSKILLTPTPDAGGDVVESALREYEKNDPRAIVLKHVPSEIFVNLLRHASCMVGNSSGGIRETGYFGLPTVNIGSRQTGRERSKNIMDVLHNKNAIESAIHSQIAYSRYPIETLYGTGDSGKKIAEIISRSDYSQIQKKLAY